MPETKPELGQAMQRPNFRETLCDLFNTVQRIEVIIGESAAKSELGLTEPAHGLTLALKSNDPQPDLVPTNVVNEAVGFTSRRGIPLFVSHSNS